MKMKEKEYIDVAKMANELRVIFLEARNSMIDKTNEDFIMERFDAEYIEERAWDIAYSFNADMCRYLHGEHKMPGNFKNIDYDYPAHIRGEVEYDLALVNDMIDRLDADDRTAQTQQDRAWLVDWFFETFGRWALNYNFSSDIAEALCELEHQNEEE